jgi:hypothetical protein
MPRVLFGGHLERNESCLLDPALIPTGFDYTKFESLRWKYHAPFYSNGGNDDQINKHANGFGKVILDLHQIPPRAKILKDGARGSTPHTVSEQLCGQATQIDRKLLWETRPLATYHYLGSQQRFLDKGDDRRTIDLHQSRTQISSAVMDGPWLDGWLHKFVQVHGLDKVKRLLPDYLI